MRKSSHRKRILIAGGAGFIGSNLVREFLAQGHKVDCVDSLITGELANLDAVRMNQDFRFIHGDIADLGIVSRLRRERYTDIYNLACPTGVPNIALLGEEMMLASSAGTLNLLHVAEQSQARYLFASTAEAYGDPEVFPQAESYAGNVDPVGPRSPYEEGKRFGEAITAYYAQRHGIDARIVRIFNTYGENMSPKDTRVIPNMLLSMATGKRVVIFGDGTNTRSFLYVTDLIEGFALVMAQRQSGEVFNIGGEREMTINELFDACRKVTGSNSKPDYQPHFIEDHRRRLPDTSKIRRLGWKPRVPIEQGLRLSYRDVRNRVSVAARNIERSVPPAVPNKAAFGGRTLRTISQ